MKNVRKVSDSVQEKKEKRLVKVPTFLTEEEINQFFSVITNPRDRFLFQMIYFFGLRVTECCKLKRSDINLKEKWIRIRAENCKVSRERLIPIPAKILSALQFYIEHLAEDVLLFDIKRSRVWELTKQYTAAAGIEKNVHPHTLRHSYASHVLGVTDNLILVKDLLGHKDVRYTQIYSHTLVKHNKEKIDRVFGS